MKAELDGVLYRFGIWRRSRGECADCGRRSDTVLIRVYVPAKEELRICHFCLIEKIHEIKKSRLRHDRKTEEQTRKKRLESLAKARQKRKEKKNGILSQSVDTVKSGKPTPAKKDDGTGDTAGGDKPILSEATPDDRPSAVYKPSQ